MAGYAFALAATIHRAKSAAFIGAAVLLPCVALFVLSGLWGGAVRGPRPRPAKDPRQTSRWW